MSDASAPARWRQPGEPLSYVDGLRELDRWPPKTKPGRNPDFPTATPFLLIPAFSGDIGTRPLAGAEAVHSTGLQVIDARGVAVATPVAGQSYTLQATVRNLGATAAYAGLLNFFVAPAAVFDAAAAGGPAPVAQARTGFYAAPQTNISVTSPAPWTPATADEASWSLLGEVFDLVLDPLQHPFDARSDRHVARLDTVAVFSGVWDGRIAFAGTNISDLFRVVIMQTGLTVSCQFFSQVGGSLPTIPQSSGSGTIVGQQVGLTTVDHFSDGTPFTTNHWTLTLTDPDTLHIEQITIFPAGDGRPTQHLIADLHRI